MFSTGPLDIEVSVTGTVPDASGYPSVPVGHSGTTHVTEISNLSTVPVDVEISGDLTANLLVFASGPTWTKPLHGVAAFIRATPPPPTQTNEPVNRPVNKGSGNETVRCSQVRWRNTGAPGWMPWHSPATSNTVAVVVPP
jgi:hypothetical protein